MNNLKIFGEALIDANAIAQLKQCVGPDDYGVLTADAHYGYNHPIGGAVAYRRHVSLSGVGFDIACGNKAVRTNLPARSVHIGKVMDDIVRHIGFGVGRPNPKPIDHPVLEAIAQAPFAPQRKLARLAANQLGTVGSGNHFVDLFQDEEGWLWVGVHFGSRGFGHKTTTGFIALHQGLGFDDHAKEGPMNGPPILLDTTTELGQAYLEALALAGDYAYAGRDVVVDTVLGLLGVEATETVHNHHNFAWRETHFGEQFWVVRKGCTPAFPGQLGFVGANMADSSVIVEGLASAESAAGLYSTVHGAGRVLSRRKAAGSVRWKRGPDGKKYPVRTEKGLIDYAEVRARLKAQRIELRGGGADEAPEVYKSLADVLAHHVGTVTVRHTLRPLGVAMAGADEYDPYKD